MTPSDTLAASDLKQQYDSGNNWGMVASIDVHNCNPAYLRDPEKLKDFITGLVEAVDMVKHGPTHIERFGDESKHPGPGYSAMQFIETSSVTLHCDEYENRIFIDLFSCKYFDPEVAETFSKDFFESSDSKMSCTIRG